MSPLSRPRHGVPLLLGWLPTCHQITPSSRPKRDKRPFPHPGCKAGRFLAPLPRRAQPTPSPLPSLICLHPGHTRCHEHSANIRAETPNYKYHYTSHLTLPLLFLSGPPGFRPDPSVSYHTPHVSLQSVSLLPGDTLFFYSPSHTLPSLCASRRLTSHPSPSMVVPTCYRHHAAPERILLPDAPVSSDITPLDSIVTMVWRFSRLAKDPLPGPPGAPP